VLLRKLHRLLRSIIAVANKMNDQTTDNRMLWELAEEHDSQIRPVNWVEECPGGLEVVENLVIHRDLLVEAKAVGIRAMNGLFASANRALDELHALGRTVHEQRRRFELDGAGGLAALERAHDAFVAQLSQCGRFEIYGIQIDGVVFDPRSWYERVSLVAAEERELAAIDELDRLRDEYVRKGLRTPPRSAFTQSKRSKRYTFAQLNVTNDYGWALLTDLLLEKLDEIGAAMEEKGFAEQLNSVYRNPARSSGASQHQYGLAADWQVFDFDRDGVAGQPKDWSLLRDVVEEADPGYIEPVEESGPGHVHADWRQS
jgi:hypothetical protein